jgi:hypothetical protein
MQKKGDDVLWYEFKPERCSEGLETEDLQIFVEVAQPGRQRDRFNAGSFRALRKGRRTASRHGPSCRALRGRGAGTG